MDSIDDLDQVIVQRDGSDVEIILPRRMNQWSFFVAWNRHCDRYEALAARNPLDVPPTWDIYYYDDHSWQLYYRLVHRAELDTTSYVPYPLFSFFADIVKSVLGRYSEIRQVTPQRKGHGSSYLALLLLLLNQNVR